MSNTQQIVIFNLEEFLKRYPEFASLKTEQLYNYFDIATGILNNTRSTPVCDEDKLETMLYLLVAHIAFLFQRGAGNVGALASASEGSVSASFSIPQNLNAQWFMQTQYGQLFWQLFLPYRLGRYIPYGCTCGN